VQSIVFRHAREGVSRRGASKWSGGRDSEPAVTGRPPTRNRCSEGIGEGREQHAPRAPRLLCIRSSEHLYKPASRCALGVWAVTASACVFKSVYARVCAGRARKRCCVKRVWGKRTVSSLGTLDVCACAHVCAPACVRVFFVWVYLFASVCARPCASLRDRITKVVLGGRRFSKRHIKILGTHDQSKYYYSTIPHESGRKPGQAEQNECQIRENANCGADTPENEVQGAHWVFSPSFLHEFLASKEYCSIKVGISYRIYALFSRYSRMKVHDSNLATLNRAKEYFQPIRAFK
jgi:hypothetical protein